MTPIVESRREGRRKRSIRKITLSATKGNLGSVFRAGVEYPAVDDQARPVTRADCAQGERPCPYASCKFHLYVDVAMNGSLIMNFPDLELDEIPQTCSLDVADAGGVKLETIADLMNLTRERVRQLEARALSKLTSPSVAALFEETAV